VRSGAPAASVRGMDNETRRPVEIDDALFADLDLFLRDSDREAPFLTEPRDEREPEDALNAQILAGLVTP
jgi:hypothetical protein